MKLKDKDEVEVFADDFDGVFRFTNATDEDFTTAWNNKDYTYPAGKTVPMIIDNCTAEQTQMIRKYFAKRLAEREFFKGKDFAKIRNGVKQNDGSIHRVASMFNEDVLQPWIDECLKPLPTGRAMVKELPEEKLNVVGKPIGKGSKDGKEFPVVDLNEAFREDNEHLLAR